MNLRASKAVDRGGALVEVRVMVTLATLLLTLSPALAIDYFVRASAGADTNDGRAPSTAFRTISRALQAAQAGDVIYVGAGTYAESLVSVRSGTAAGLIRLVGDADGARTGDPGVTTITSSTTALTVTHNNISVERLTLANGTRTVVWSGTGGTLLSCTIRSASDDNVRVTAGSLTITSCTIRTGGGDGVFVGGGAVTVQSSTIHDLSGSAIVLDTNGATLSALNNTIRSISAPVAISVVRGSATIANNVVRACTGVGVDIAQPNQGNGASSALAQVWNNTFHGISAAGVRLTNGTATVRNNITASGGSGLRYVGGTLTHSNNLYFGLAQNYEGVAAGAGDVLSDPMFVDAASDWQLRTGSPAINAGISGSSITARDRIGTSRPIGAAFDLGAFEFSSVTPVPVPHLSDFESGSAGSAWNQTTVDSTATANLSRYLGRFANQSVTLRLSTMPGTDYYAIFDLYAFDSLDGESTQWGPDYFGVTVNGDILFRHTVTNSPATYSFSMPDWPERWGVNLGGSAGNDSLYRSVAVAFTADSTITNLGFFGQNLQGGSDESWGIDNVRVVTAAGAQAFLPNFTEQGRFRGHSATTFSAEPSGVFVGDVTGDGMTDVVQGGSTLTSGGVTGSILSIGTATPGIFSRAALPVLSIRQGALADFNGDGRLDFFTPTANDTETLLLGGALGMSNAGALTFTSPSGLDATVATDLNADGLVDVVSLATNGNFAGLNTPVVSGTPPVPPLNPLFTLTSTSGILPNDVSNAGAGQLVSSGDLNDDGIADFYYHYGTGRLLLSQTDRTYAHAPRIPGVPFSESFKAGSVMADYDNDGDLDLLIARHSGGVLLYRNPGSGGTFADVTAAAGLPTTGGTISADFGDFDHDGDQDLFISAVSGSAAMYVNSGAPSYTFTLATEGVATDTRGGDCLFADVDTDGDLDLLLGTQATSHASRLFINALNEQDPVAAQRRLMVRVQGRGQGGTNLAGAGVRVELWNADNTQFLQRRDLGAARGLGGQRPLIAHFGGVTPSTTYTLRVYFVGGVQTFTVVPAIATTTIGSTTIPGLFTALEGQAGPAVVVVRWREVPGDE